MWYFLREAAFGRAGRNMLRLRRDFVEALLQAPTAAAAYLEFERLGYVGRVDRDEAPAAFGTTLSLRPRATASAGASC